MIAIIILFLVFVLIATRKIGKIQLKIWQIMSLGAVGVIITGQITPADSIRSVNMDVILFLFGVFVIGRALEDSGYLGYLSYRVFRKAASLDMLILTILFVMGAASMLLMNDTLAIIGTPVMLHLAKRHNISPRLLLLTLAFSITIGSVTSPIGNPQNLLIAVEGSIANPFITFLKYLFLPSFINILLAFVILKIFYSESFNGDTLNHLEETIKDHHLSDLSRLSLTIMISLIILKIVYSISGIGIDLELVYISLVSALPILLLHAGRWSIISRVDWQTILFFISMFILMQSVWDTGFFQDQIFSFQMDVTGVPVILAVSVTLSQLISNVPLVALYMPILTHAGAGVPELMALAAGSTIAGNLTILGAASNVIIIQNAEKYGQTIGFIDFIKIGIPLSMVNIGVYYIFLA